MPGDARQRGTTVDVAVDVAESHARVTVTDAAPDIAAEQRGKLGRRFYRAPGTQAPVSGLVLSTVQRLVDLHRGTWQLNTSSTAIGRCGLR